MAGEIPTRDAAASTTDAELLAAARQATPAALEALLVRYQPHLYRFGLRMCGNEDDAGDVAQESLISMARSLRDFRGDASVSSWLYTIARSYCIKKRRRSKFAPTREESLDAQESTQTNALLIRSKSAGKERGDGRADSFHHCARAHDAQRLVRRGRPQSPPPIRGDNSV